ncbi:MAG: capsule biosynthesis phosphatase [Myxococcota bacterium]
MHPPYVIVDLDGTLTVDDPSRPYPDKALNRAVAEAVAAAPGAGYRVMVMTARGMRTWKNDRAKVEEHVRPGVEAWLAKMQVRPEQVHVGKPWCGPRGFYVDDRNLHLEEFVFRFAGPYAGQPVRAVVTGVPEGPLAPVHTHLTRVERWLDVCSWVYTDAPAESVHDRRLGAGDGRAPMWTLVLPLDSGRPCAEAWFALHADDHTGGPGVVLPDGGRGGFALVPASEADPRAPLPALAARYGEWR